MTNLTDDEKRRVSGLYTGYRALSLKHTDGLEPADAEPLIIAAVAALVRNWIAVSQDGPGTIRLFLRAMQEGMEEWS